MIIDIAIKELTEHQALELEKRILGVSDATYTFERRKVPGPAEFGEEREHESAFKFAEVKPTRVMEYRISANVERLEDFKNLTDICIEVLS